MGEYYFSAGRDNATTLHIAPITDDKLVTSGQNLRDTSGYFLYETDQSQKPATVRILAQLLTDEAAFELSEMLNLE